MPERWRLLRPARYLVLIPVVALSLALSAPTPFPSFVKRTPSDGGPQDRYGQSLAMTPATVIVGAPNADLSTAPGDSLAGAVYILDRDHGGTGAWGETTKLLGSDTLGGDYFGYAVAIDGDRVLVGARHHDGQASFEGAAYVFERNWGGLHNWGEVTKIAHPGEPPNAFDEFGQAVALSGDTAAIGTPYLKEPNMGGVYLFERNTGGADSWGKVKEIVGGGRFFGIDVALDGSTLAVGASLDQVGDDWPGAVYVYERDAGGTGAWGQVRKVVPPDPAVAILFGNAVDLDGDTLVVGTSTSAVYLFERHQNGLDHWGFVKKIFGPASSQFGDDVSLDGDLLLVGAWGWNGCQGAAFVYQRDRGGPDQWGLFDSLTDLPFALDDCACSTVALAGDTLALGAPDDDDDIDPTGLPDMGSIYVLGRDSSFLFADGFESGNTTRWSSMMP